MKRKCPFRGDTPPTLKARLRQARDKRKWDAEDRQKRGARGFGMMLRLIALDVRVGLAPPSYSWRIWRGHWPARERLAARHRKRPNLAQERAYDLPF